jgi:MFS family permease
MTPEVKPKQAESQAPAPIHAGGYAWYVLIVLTAVYTLSFIDRQILTYLVGPIRRDLGINDSQVGLLGGLAFALFYTFLGLPIGRYADLGHRRNLISIGVAVWSLFTAACAGARSFFTLFLARMGVGVGEATLAPAAYSMIADYFPKERLGVAMSVYYLGNLIGSSLAQFLGGSIVEAVSKTPEVTVPLFGTIASWRTTFLILGVPGLLFALLVFTIREPLRKGLIKNAAGRESLSVGETIAQVRMRWQTVAGVSVAFVFQAACNYGFMLWGPQYFLRVFDWGPARTGTAMGLIIITFGCMGLYTGGWLCDRWQRRGIIDAPVRVAIPCAIGMGLLFPFAMTASSPEWSLALIAPGLFFMGMPMGTAAAALQVIFPNQLRGQVTALYLFVLNLGALTIGPFVPGFLNDYVFGDPKMVGYSIGLTIGVASVLMLVVILMTLGPFRRHYLAMHPEARASR